MPLPVNYPALERLIHRDPGGRGLASFQHQGCFLDAGQLAVAARSLAAARSVGIVTGFCVVDAQPPAAETDGPPGALFLARALRTLNIDATLVSDRFASPLLRAGCAAFDMPEEIVCEVGPGDIDQLLTGRGRPWTHLIAIERVGPNHTLSSLLAQPRDDAPPVAQFEQDVPSADRDICHNMRGMSVDAVTVPLHRLFEIIGQRRLPIVTIGIADGGNEIGMGGVAWEMVRAAVRSPVAGRIACRIVTDYLILAGVSDWAAYALAAAVCAESGRRDIVSPWKSAGQRRLIETLVRAGALDGVTRTSQATVDGLPLERYLEMWEEIRSLLSVE
jgi:D-glutamate cyclase